MINTTSQNYNNHRKYYIAHHFIFYPILFLLIIADTICLFKFHHVRLLFGFIDVLLLMLGWESYMLRQHYSLGNQDRIIRLEMRLRYYQLTQKSFEPLEKQLTFSQIAALRFASDEELISLISTAIKDNLNGNEIKKSIRNWVADDMRV